MRYFIFVVTALVFVGAVYYYATYYSTGEDSSRTDSTVQLPKNASPDSVEIQNRTTVKAVVPQNTNQNEITNSIVTDAQKASVIEQEEKLLGLAREYESLRSEPDKRKTHREDMQQQLAAYSEDVLPVALEKIKAAQPSN